MDSKSDCNTIEGRDFDKLYACLNRGLSDRVSKKTATNLKDTKDMVRWIILCSIKM